MLSNAKCTPAWAQILLTLLRMRWMSFSVKVVVRLSSPLVSIRWMRNGAMSWSLKPNFGSDSSAVIVAEIRKSRAIFLIYVEIDILQTIRAKGYKIFSKKIAIS